MPNHLLRNSCLIALLFLVLISCDPDSSVKKITYEAIEETFGTSINLNDLPNYANQTKPAYITRNNSGSNPITDKGALLGRVLFYDTNLSSDKTISCASCHKQEFAFSDEAIASTGVNGDTERHSMRLVNSKFSSEIRFFWDERASSLEEQTTMPIRNHGEMGFSGTNGDQTFDDLLTRLQAIPYYQELFEFTYGDDQITEVRMQQAIAQFIRTIQSFDSKYDIGRAQAPNDGAPFANFTMQENQGKMLFLTPPIFDVNGNRTGGGVGCAGCHRPPEFDIDPNSLNNGHITTIAGGTDVSITRAPTLRDMLRQNGTLNGPLMHTGNMTTLNAVLDHYNQISITGNTNLDPRLRPGGNAQNLQLTVNEKASLEAFLKTLSGSNVYVDSKWSNPFPN
jgi:cytochrome c peroxidase